MRVAAFMSGSGTNIVRLLEWERTLSSREGNSPFETLFVFSDRSDGSCRGESVALEYGIPYFSHDIRMFYQRRGLKRAVGTPEGLAARKEYDRTAATLVRAFEVDVIVLGGYMSYTTLDRCINVHPADLSILTPEGTRKYVGDHAVLEAIAAGERELRASTIWTDRGVDTGPLLMVSGPVPVEISEPLGAISQDREKLARIAEEHQRRLKERGDWKILPRTVEMVARGRFALDGEGRVYVDGRAAPGGYREKDGDPRIPS